MGGMKGGHTERQTEGGMIGRMNIDLGKYLSAPTLPSLRSVLDIDPPKIQIDPIVATPLKVLTAKLGKADGTGVDKPLDEFVEQVDAKGWTDHIARLTGTLNRESLDDASRLLLSTKTIYTRALLTATAAGIQPENTAGMRDRVRRFIQQQKEALLSDVTRAVLAARGISLGELLDKAVVARAVAADFPIAAGKVEPAVLKIYEMTIKGGTIPAYVNWYIEKEQIPEATFSASIRQGMADYLLGVGVPYKAENFAERFEKGHYDEFFALAYEHARKRSVGEDDPIDVIRSKGSVAAWDFTVDLFEDVEQQGVVKENILAAGALDYIYWFGDFLGIYKIVDAIVLRWASGLLDVANGPAAAKLYRYFKLRDERSSEEERAMLYRRVLNRGEAELLSKMVPNTSFPALWHKLMAEVAEFIRKSEETSGGPDQVSTAPIHQAVRDLQYNLTDHMTGLAHMQVREMYAHLQEAIDIIRDEEIVQQVGGGARRNMWTVIERIAREEFQTALNVSAIRTLAIEGNRIYRWIAEFDASGASRGTAFGLPGIEPALLEGLLRPAEAWILAQSDIEATLGTEEPEGEADDGAGVGNSGGDDFADWND